MREMIDESKNVQTTPPAPTTSAVGPCPAVIQIVGCPGTGSLSSTIAPPDHPRFICNSVLGVKWVGCFIVTTDTGFTSYIVQW